MGYVSLQEGTNEYKTISTRNHLGEGPRFWRLGDGIVGKKNEVPRTLETISATVMARKPSDCFPWYDDTPVVFSKRPVLPGYIVNMPKKNLNKPT